VWLACLHCSREFIVLGGYGRNYVEKDGKWHSVGARVLSPRIFHRDYLTPEPVVIGSFELYALTKWRDIPLNDFTPWHQKTLSDRLGIEPERIGYPCPHVLNADDLLIWTLWTDKDDILHPACVDCVTQLRGFVNISG
jgi:hypothetical protein